MSVQARPRLTYLQRKPRRDSNFSVEFIFDDVRSRLSGEIDATVRVAPIYSNGLFRRVGIMLDVVVAPQANRVRPPRRWRHGWELEHPLAIGLDPVQRPSTEAADLSAVGAGQLSTPVES